MASKPATHKPFRPLTKRHEVAPRSSSTQRGYGYRWQQAREAYLKAHPLCVMCRERGRITEATVVDHIVPHRGDPVLFWDRTNWQSLCKTDHDSVKQRIEKQAQKQERLSSSSSSSFSSSSV